MGFAQSQSQFSSGGEHFNRNVPGGDHPVKLGNRLNAGRYKVIYKLGRGAYSTVWLAHEASQERFVAIKITVASLFDDTHERDIRQLLVEAAATSTHPGRNYVQQLLDVFVEVGPKDRHQCFVSTPGAASVASCMEASRGVCVFSLEVSRAISAQMILGTGFLHSRGIVHGDLHLGNCLLLFALESAQSDTQNSSGFVLTRREDGTVPAPRVPPRSLAWESFSKPRHTLTLRDARIMLSDFGGSWQPALEDKYTAHTPFSFRPPEGLFAARERPLGPAADVWALACAVFAVHTDHELFEPVADASEALAEHVSALGRPPQAWWDMWDDGDFEFEFECRPLRDRVRDVREERADYVDEFGEDEPAFGDEEVDDLENMLAAMLRWDPDDRITVPELVECAWMRKWGLPTLHRMETELRG